MLPVSALRSVPPLATPPPATRHTLNLSQHSGRQSAFDTLASQQTQLMREVAALNNKLDIIAALSSQATGNNTELMARLLESVSTSSPTGIAVSSMRSPAPTSACVLL